MKNHWGTRIEILGHAKILRYEPNNTTELWDVLILDSGENNIYSTGDKRIFSEYAIATEGFKPLKKYTTRLWKVLNN